MIVPPKEHTHVEELVKAGMFAIMTLDAPGAQGAEVAGVHAWGVSTPLAADVADATAGLAIEVHMAKPVIFT